MDFDKIDEGHEDGQERMVFHYNREERLKTAPKLVQDYYAGNFTAFRPGLFKALVATKANRFILFALVICFLFVVVYGFFGPKENEDSLDGVHVSLSAFTYQEFGDTIYVDFKISPPSQRFVHLYNKMSAAKVTFSAINAESQVAEKKVMLADYDGARLYNEKKEILNKIKAEKKKGGKKSVKVPEFGIELKTSFSDFDIISIEAQLELNGKNVTVSSPVKRVEDMIR